MADQLIKTRDDMGEVEISPDQKLQLSKLGLVLKAFLVADVAFAMFLSFGFVIPSKIQLKDADVAMPDSYYAVTAKQSPLAIPDYSAHAPQNKVPLISARALPLVQVPAVANSVLPVLNTNYVPSAPMTSGEAANAEADLTTLRKRTTL